MSNVIVLRMSYLWMINYTYLVVDPVSRQAVIVDPAWQLEKIEQCLRSAESKLSGILLTHAHPDHTHLAKPLAKQHRCPIWISREEIRASGFRDTRLVGIDTTPWSVGVMRIHPIFTPGHSPGSICYLIEDNLFTGDTLFAEGCGLCFDTRSAHLMFASLEHLKSRLDPQTLIFPGHSYGRPPGQTFSRLLKENIYLGFANKEDFAAFRLRKGLDKSKIFNFR